MATSELLEKFNNYDCDGNCYSCEYHDLCGAIIDVSDALNSMLVYFLKKVNLLNFEFKLKEEKND